jgi:D-psicose/D-tagatose/L-ribulose 3-epimerase
MDEAVAVVREMNSPAVATMFDVHNAEDETEPHDLLIQRHFELVRHVHVNENDGGHPGSGKYDFVRMFAILEKLAYRGWVSVEAFDFPLGAETIASGSLACLRKAAGE